MIEETYLAIFGVTVIILFIALIILTYKVFNLQNTLSATKNQDIGEKKTKVPTAKEEIPEIIPPERTPEPKRTIMPNINLTEGTSDMDESMKRYAKKYVLDSATLASMDGFSLASSHANSDKEAANLTARYQENAITEIGDTHIMPLNYRGEEILILFRTADTINNEKADMMKRDGVTILSKWL